MKTLHVAGVRNVKELKEINW